MEVGLYYSLSRSTEAKRKQIQITFRLFSFSALYFVKTGGNLVSTKYRGEKKTSSNYLQTVFFFGSVLCEDRWKPGVHEVQSRKENKFKLSLDCQKLGLGISFFSLDYLSKSEVDSSRCLTGIQNGSGFVLQSHSKYRGEKKTSSDFIQTVFFFGSVLCEDRWKPGVHEVQRRKENKFKLPLDCFLFRLCTS